MQGKKPKTKQMQNCAFFAFFLRMRNTKCGLCVREIATKSESLSQRVRALDGWPTQPMCTRGGKTQVQKVKILPHFCISQKWADPTTFLNSDRWATVIREIKCVESTYRRNPQEGSSLCQLKFSTSVISRLHRWPPLPTKAGKAVLC